MSSRSAILELPVDIVVAVDALGSVLNATIGGFTAAITFPIAVTSNQLGVPPGFDPPPGEFHIWGYQVTAGWSITSVALTVDLAPGGPGNFMMQFAAWFAIVREWVYAKNQIPLTFSSGSAMRLHLGASALHFSPTLHLIPGISGSPRAELQAASDRASRDERLPLQNRLLLSAFSALIVLDHRRAVIDAGTAAEVALGTFIDGVLRSKGVAADAIDRIVLQANGAVGLYSLATKLGLTCPAVSKGRLSSELAERRNKVAHAGADVTNKEAATAVGCARELVATATPLNFP